MTALRVELVVGFAAAFAGMDANDAPFMKLLKRYMQRQCSSECQEGLEGEPGSKRLRADLQVISAQRPSWGASLQNGDTLVAARESSDGGDDAELLIEDCCAQLWKVGLRLYLKHLLPLQFYLKILLKMSRFI